MYFVFDEVAERIDMNELSIGSLTAIAYHLEQGQDNGGLSKEALALFLRDVANELSRPLEDAKDAEIARLTAEIEQLSNREISLLSHLKNNGKLLKAGGKFDEYNFDRYLTPVNAAYVDGLIFQHNEKYK